MHTRGRPEEWRNLPPLRPNEVLPLVAEDLRRLSAQALRAGIAHDRLLLDPGFGFGKRFEENYPLLARLGELHQLGFPILAGTSRKSFLSKTLYRHSQDESIERLSGTIAAVTASILQGAHIVRVHDAGAVAAAARVADAIVASGETCPTRGAS
jgi:dihydropteroate synthase